MDLQRRGLQLNQYETLAEYRYIAATIEADPVNRVRKGTVAVSISANCQH